LPSSISWEAESRELARSGRGNHEVPVLPIWGEQDWSRERCIRPVLRKGFLELPRCLPGQR
ncbi:MAG: hypothetical protein ACU833_15320, partial [Gammaproteobacteria bacterium]